MFSTWRLALLVRLQDSADPVLAAVAAQGVKEITYHRDYAAQWVIRLGDGTDYSRQRMQAGLAAVAPLVAELFEPSAVERGWLTPALRSTRRSCGPSSTQVLAQVLAEAGLDWPEAPAWPECPARPAGTACTPRRWATCWPSCRASPARMPGATW